MKTITPERIKELIDYDQVNGILIMRKSGRRIFPDDNGTTIVYDGKSYRFKLDKICMTIINGSFPDSDLRVLHKNMDKNDFRACNLRLVSRDTYKLVKEAFRNLNGGIRYDHHHYDKLMYVVQYYENNILRKSTMSDLGKVKRMILNLQLKYSKILTKYCVFD